MREVTESGMQMGKMEEGNHKRNVDKIKHTRGIHLHIYVPQLEKSCKDPRQVVLHAKGAVLMDYKPPGPRKKVIFEFPVLITASLQKDSSQSMSVIYAKLNPGLEALEKHTSNPPVITKCINRTSMVSFGNL